MQETTIAAIATAPGAGGFAALTIYIPAGAASLRRRQYIISAAAEQTGDPL